MNKTASEAELLVTGFLKLSSPAPHVRVVLAPPFTAIQATKLALASSSHILLGGQNLYWEDAGPFTGEISAPMLKNLGCDYVILGHSERRQHFAEKDRDINKKIKAALRHDLAPILCVGESLSEREGEQTEAVVTRQLLQGFEGLAQQEMSKVAVAYEPVWAIGTGRAATVSQAEEVHVLLRKTLRETWGQEHISMIPILYGGSVSPTNAKELLSSSHVDGALVGGACLNPEAFATIISVAQELGQTS